MTRIFDILWQVNQRMNYFDDKITKKCIFLLFINNFLVARKEVGQLLSLSANGHPAYTPVKLNIKTAVSFNNKIFFLLIEII
jgi:hypothetical protein